MQYQLNHEDIIAAVTAYAKSNGLPSENLVITFKTTRNGSGDIQANVMVGSPASVLGMPVNLAVASVTDLTAETVSIAPSEPVMKGLFS